MVLTEELNCKSGYKQIVRELIISFIQSEVSHQKGLGECDWSIVEKIKLCYKVNYNIIIYQLYLKLYL